MQSLPRVLIVEDDPAIRGLLVAALGRESLTIDSAPDGVAGLEKLRANAYSVIVVDLMMPRMDGFALLDAVRDLRLAMAPVIFVMSAFDDNALLALDPTLVHGCFKKPFDVDSLVQTVRDCAVLRHSESDAAEVEPPHDASGETTFGVC